MRSGLVLLALLAVACHRDDGAGPATGAGANPSSGDRAAAGSPAAATDDRRAPAGSFAWEDPEPPGAQAIAEAAVAAPWNAAKTTRLTMSITTLVDRTTAIAGGSTAGVAAREVSLAERLDRLHATVTGQEIVIRLASSVLFDFDRAELRADAERLLSEVAAVATAHADRAVRVEGHTDAIGSDAYNQSLSERRAAAVASWLAAHGVARNRLQTVGHGEGRPVGDNATAAGRQQNRRVEIVLAAGGN